MLASISECLAYSGLALRAEVSAVGDNGIIVMDVDGSCSNVALEAAAVGVCH